MGFDCSGFVQTLYRFFQIQLPRDSTPQRHQLAKTDAPQAGDLAFFPGHVVLVTDSQNFIHANFFDNRVFYGSFDQQSPLFRQQLASQLLGFRRVEN